MIVASPTASVGGSSGPGDDRVLADRLRGRLQHVGRDVDAGESEAVDELDGALDGALGDRRGGVHREVDAAVDRDGGHQRHDRHEGLHQHAAVADQFGLPFLLDQLRCGTRRDQRVEAGECTAGDGDEQEREQGARHHRRVGPSGELADRRHGDLGPHDDDRGGQHHDGADLHEGGQVVARGQQQPHRQDGRDEPVDDDEPGEHRTIQVQVMLAPVGLGDPAAGHDHRDQQHETDDRDFGHLPGPQVAQVDAHEQRDRDGHADREHTPDALAEGVDYDQRQDGDDDDHDGQRREQGGGATDDAELVAGHLA